MPDSSTDFPAPGIDTIAKLAVWAGERYSEIEGLVDETERLSFAEYTRRARAIARGLMAQGVGIGDRVAIWAPNSIAFAVAALGIHIAGGVLVPINTRFKRAEVEYLVHEAKISVAFTVDEFLGTAYSEILSGLYPAAGIPTPRIVVFDTSDARSVTAFVDDAAAVSDAELDERIAGIMPDHIATMLFTSGTTGRPKGAMLRHGALVRAYWTWSGIASLREGDRFLCTNPFFHAFGLKVGLLSALSRGATIYPVAVFNAEHSLEIIERERITYYPGPPPIYQAMMTSPDLARRDISSLRVCVTGATAVPPQLIYDIYDRLGFEEVHSPYGFTEGTGVATITLPPDSRETVATTVGPPMPGITVRVVREDGTEADVGETGEVVVSGYNHMAGFLDPETGGALESNDHGELHSGDLGEFDERGYLRIRGRIKDMYIVGGFNVYPAEIEARIQELEDVLAVAVVGMPDDRLGEAGCAFVVGRPDHSLDEAQIIAWCRENLANFKVPKRVVLVDQLPLNASGKVAKKDLIGLIPSSDLSPQKS